MADKSKKPVYIKSEKLSCTHAFSTRVNGVSSGIYDSLNLGISTGDDIKNIKKNWEIFLSGLNIASDKICYAKQVHENRVVTVGKDDLTDQISFEGREFCDALVTNEKNVPLVVFTADCVPVLMQDPKAGVIAAVHCGWRSTVADIEKNVLEAMCSLGARAEEIKIAVGPAISKCCFETGPEVVLACEKLLGEELKDLVSPSVNEGKSMIDLKGVVCRRFMQLGIKKENIDNIERCTYCEPELFWSHRYTKGVRGSQANLIMLG